MRRIPRVIERKRMTKSKRRNHQKGKCAVPQLERERWRERGDVGEEMGGSISNFSAEFTVDSFPIRLG